MRKTLTISFDIFILFSFTGCNKLLGGTVLERFGMEFTSQIEMIEEYLDTTVEALLKSSGANEQFAFDDIKKGRFIISGVSLDKDEFE